MQDIPSLDSEIVKDMSIYGRAYELIYADASSQPRSVKLNPENTFICYGQTVTESKLLAVYYYKKYDLDGSCKGIECYVYDSSYIYIYSCDTDNFAALELKEKTRHYFGDVPVIEYRNNEEMQGDFEQLISLIDAYNTLASDRVNDKEQFVDAFLFLSGIDIDSDQAKKLREEKILMGFENSTAQYLNKNLNEADTEVLRNNLKEDIHRFSKVPDLSDESFGNNLSGVAIKYKLLGFEQHIKYKERRVAAGLRARFSLYTNFLSLKGAMEYVPTHRVDIVFNHNLPANNLEIAQMISYLADKVTQETLLGQLDFVGDAKEEAQLAQKEAAKKADEAAARANSAWMMPKRNEK